MKRLISTMNMFYLFALTLWIGGMFLLGILVEIIVRVKLKEQPLVASKVMNTVMDAFNVHIIYYCIGTILIAELVKFLVAKSPRSGYSAPRVTKSRFSREIILAIMIVLAVYVGSGLRPEMHAMDQLKKAEPQNEKLQIQFDRLHSRLTWLYTVNMIFGLSLLYIHGKEMARFREDDGSA